MASIAEIRRDPSGAPACSVTFLLSRRPAPHEPIAGLVMTATLAVDLRCTLDDLAWVEFTLQVAEPVRTESRGPFGAAALAATFAGDDARGLLAALAGGGGGPDLVIRARRTDGMSGQWRRPVADLIAPLLGADPERVVHLVTAEGGTVGDVFPARSTRTRGPRQDMMLLRNDAVLPVAMAVRPHAVLLDASIRHEILLPILLTPAETGPVLSDAPLLADRGTADRWYLPEVTLVAPAPGQDPGGSPFRFDLVPSGHQPDGSPGLEATVVLTLAAGPSAATREAWEQAGRPAMKPVPCEIQVALRIPFRAGQDTHDEPVAASSMAVQGVFGEDGSRVTATFELQDTWARLAYGALSTPGFQANPPSVEVTMAHKGWRASHRLPFDSISQLSAGKLIALRRREDSTRSLAATQLMGMAKAEIRLTPAIAQLRPEKLQALHVIQYTEVATTATRRVECVLPCADHGQLYRQSGPGGWDAIGCQPALRLGETEYRLWQPEPVTSTTQAAVFRSLTQPGRYLVVPTSYCVGRYPADEPGRAYEPTLLLTSTIDVENPANIRCVLAAALEPELNAAQLALLAGELRAKAGRAVDLVTPWQAGLTPEVRWAAPQADSLDCVAIDTGFTLVLTTDIPGLLTLRALLQRGGLVGSARYRLAGGDEVTATLRLDLSRVVGPPDGPVDLVRSGDELQLTNRLGRRVAVQRLIADGAVVASPGVMLAPGATASVAVPAGTPDPVLPDCAVEPGTESLDETRSYIEDLHLGVTFVATGDLTSVAGLEVAATFLGAAADPVTLTRTQRQAERQFVLPLTTYAADPAVTFTVTAVGTDGTRTAAPPVDWPVRTRGVLVPLSTPVPQ